MKPNLPDRVYREIMRYAQKYDIAKVILFGSRARGNHTERSDIDLAVRGGDFDRFYWALKENAHTLLMMDIVDLDHGVSEELLEEIRRDGVILYEKA